MKVLIAEDDFITSRALEKSLKDWGFDVSLAKNGNDAWALIQKEDIRLAIIDWMMPGIDGLELCHKIREKSQEKEARYVYIILLTGRDNQTDIIQGLTSGADDYMTKPFDFLELKVRLQKGVRIIQREESRILEASVDSLTKLWNRKKIFKFFQEEFERGHREKNPTGVI
ncbi:MAG: response regulator, partial [Acidobacteriota bacterium]